MITASTVGYGDIKPVRKSSKVLAIVIAFMGMVLAGTVIAVALESIYISLERHANEEVIEKIKGITE
jgi:voltage-gated potassium channel